MASSTKNGNQVARVSFVSLGCPKNLVDSEKMLGVLKQSGFELVNEDQRPDAIVVNTCGFLEASKDESLEVIHDAIRRKEKGEIKRVVVAGCLVQRHRAKLLEWAPGIDAMVGVFDRDHIVDAVAGEKAADLAEKAPKYWIAGNALQAAAERGMKTVGLTVNGADEPQRIDLPLKPTRCDAHAFAESGGATAFKIGLHLDGEPGQITLRMTPAGAANAINYARASCGLLETVDGGVEG